MCFAVTSCTINSIPLVDSDDEIVGSMGADDFVENPGEQINTSVKETLTLYFADRDQRQGLKKTSDQSDTLAQV